MLYAVKPNELRILKTFVETDYLRIFKLLHLNFWSTYKLKFIIYSNLDV